MEEPKCCRPHISSEKDQNTFKCIYPEQSDYQITFYKCKNIPLKYIIHKISHSRDMMKRFVLSCAFLPSVSWWVAIGNLRELCQRFVFQALTCSCKTFLDLSECHCTRLLSYRSSLLCWLQFRNLRLYQGCADFSWSRLLDRRSSDKYPAQVGGAYGDAAGD